MYLLFCHENVLMTHSRVVRFLLMCIRREVIQKIFESFKTISKSMQRKNCKLDVIVPVVTSSSDTTSTTLFYTDPERPYVCRSFDFRQKKFSDSLPLDTIKVWYIDYDHLWNVMLRDMLQRYYALVIANVQGIPMKDTGSKANYDVQLACRGVSIEISQDLSITDSFLNLKWLRAEPKKNVEYFYMTKSVHRVTPLYPYTTPTLCLMKHLASGKPVTLNMASTYNETFNIEVTHLMLQHGSDVYLHVLHPSKMFLPWLTLPRTIDEDREKLYRVAEFEELIKLQMLRSNVPTIHAMLTNSQQKPNGKNEVGSNSSDLTLATTSDDIRSKVYSLMKHNGFIYEVPAPIERFTRFFPLCVDEESMVFCNGNQISHPTLYEQIIHPLWEFAVKKAPEQLSENDLREVQTIIAKLFQAAQKNDTSLMPEIQDHTRRYQSYRKLWSEIRMFMITLSQNDHILALMDKKWPQFFFDKTSIDTNKNQDQPRRNKRMVEVQRDRYGNVIFPIPLGALTIHSLGKVVYDRPNYHTDKYLWPVGYKSTRYYTSVKDTNNRCLYTCEIHDGGENPVFVLTSDDNPDQPIRASSATAAWTVIVKKVNEIKTEEAGKRVFTNVSGPEYYGLAHPTVMKLISELPNAEKCVRPNAPHQPASKQSVSVSKDQESEDESMDDVAPVVPSSIVSPTEFVAPATPSVSPNASPVNAVQAIIARRQQRDKRVLQDSEVVKSKLCSTSWKKHSSLLKFNRQKQGLLDAELPTLDGRKEGPPGLYVYMRQLLQMQQQQQAPTQPSSSYTPHPQVPTQVQHPTVTQQIPAQHQAPHLPYSQQLPQQTNAPTTHDHQMFQPTQADNLNSDKLKKNKSNKKKRNSRNKKRPIGGPPTTMQPPTKIAKSE